MPIILEAPSCRTSAAEFIGSSDLFAVYTDSDFPLLSIAVPGVIGTAA